MNQAASETADRERLPYFYKHILFGSVSGCEINVSISMATKRKLACLTAEQKKEICVFHGNNSNKKQQEIADILSARLDQTVSRRTVGDIVAEKQKWLDCCHSSSSKKIRAGKHVEMEAALQISTNF